MYWFNESINDMKNEIINDKINSIEEKNVLHNNFG